MVYHLLPIRKRPLDCSLIEPAVEKSSTSEAPEDRPHKKVLDCSLIKPALKKSSTSKALEDRLSKRVLDCSPIKPAFIESSTSKAPEDGPRKRVSFSDQTSTKPPICHHDGTKGSVSRLDLVDVCGSGDVVPSPVTRTNNTDNREKSPLLPFIEGSPSNNSRGVQFQTAFNHYSPKSGEGNKQTNVPTYLFHKNAPAIERAWSGIMEVDGMMRLSVKMTAHLSAKVSRKAYEFSKKINPKLHSKLLYRAECYPRIFQDSRPNRDDIALYFYLPKDDRPNGILYAKLLRRMKDEDLMMLSRIDGIELLMFSSTILQAGSRRSADNNYFIWGVFRSGR